MSALPKFPNTLVVQPERIPAALKEGRKHVAWDWRMDNGKPTKPPVNPDTGKFADSTAPSTWATFGAALAYARRHDLPGIGRVLTPTDDLAGIDLDHCVDPDTGAIESWALAIVAMFAPTYCEYSPTGTGIRIFVRGQLDDEGCKAGNIEMYDQKRYLTMTGHPIPGAAEIVAERQDALATLARRLRADRVTTPAGAMEFAADLDAEGAAILERVRPLAPGEHPRRPALSDRIWKIAHGDDAVLKPTKDGVAPYEGESERRYAIVCSLYDLGLNDDEVKAAFKATVRWERCVADHGDKEAERRLTTQDMPKAKGFIGKQRGDADAKAREEQARLAAANNLDVDAETGEILTPPAPPTPSNEGIRADPAPRRPFTDLGNAERLIDRHGPDLHYVVEAGSWATWQENRWTLDDTGATDRMAKETVRSIYREAADSPAGTPTVDVGKHAVKSEAAPRIAAMIALAQTEAGIPIHLQDFDANAFLINCADGVIDLHSGQKRQHDRAELHMKCVPVSYHPDAAAPTWENFLAQVLPDEETRRFVQRAVGYSLTASTREQKFFLLYGGGSNGKSTFLEAIAALFADYAQSATMDTFAVKKNEGGIPNDIARMVGARLITTVETNEGMRINESLIKQLTGGDRITARFLHREFFDFIPTHKLWVSVNHKPVIKGTDHAIWRRPVLIPFTVTIPDDAQDKTLPAKLRAELPGILAWAVRGCLDWQHEGLAAPQAVRDATDEYRAEMDTLATFIEDRCSLSKNAWVTSSDLYRSYREWCEDSGERYDTETMFGKRLTERGFTRNKRSGQRCWIGITLATNAVQGDLDTLDTLDTKFEVFPS